MSQINYTNPQPSRELPTEPGLYYYLPLKHRHWRFCRVLHYKGENHFDFVDAEARVPERLVRADEGFSAQWIRIPGPEELLRLQESAKWVMHDLPSQTTWLQEIEDELVAKMRETLRRGGEIKFTGCPPINLAASEPEPETAPIPPETPCHLLECRAPGSWEWTPVELHWSIANSQLGSLSPHWQRFKWRFKREEQSDEKPSGA